MLLTRPRTMHLLNQASLAVRTHLEAALRDLQMTGIQYTILATIKDHEGISSAELSRRFFVTAQTANEIINGLVARGLIARDADDANKRILRMRLTAKGRKLHSRCDEIAERIEAVAFGWVNPTDYQNLRESLRALLRELRDRAPLLNAIVQVKRQRVSKKINTKKPIRKRS